MRSINQLTIAALLTAAASPCFAEDGKILLSPHGGFATVIGLTDVNSDKAIVRFTRKLDDEVEDCAREIGDTSDSKAVAKCVKNGVAQEYGRIYTRRAYCSRLTIYTEFGNFSMVNHEREKESSGVDGKPYRPIRTDWKDHRSGDIVGNCSACNTPTMIDTLKVLCPVFYNQLFRGADPY